MDVPSRSAKTTRLRDFHMAYIRKLPTKNGMKWRCGFRIQKDQKIENWEKVFSSQEEAKNFADLYEQAFIENPEKFRKLNPTRKNTKIGPVGNSINARIVRIEEKLDRILERLS